MLLQTFSKNMNYVIYGAGYRGRRLFNYIKDKSVLAFIDSDVDKQRMGYCGKPVISLEEYEEKYMFAYIIATPIYSDEVEKILQKHNIYQYTSLGNMPSEFAEYGQCKFDNCYKKLKDDYGDSFCLYGLNAFSLLMYDFLSTNKNVFIYPAGECELRKIEWIKKYYPEVKIKTYKEILKNEVILITETENKKLNFSNKTVNLFEYANDNIEYRNDKLLTLKNIFKGEKCFIVATGPSLRTEDLKILKENNIFCFGVNSIIKINEIWMADAYVAIDSNFISNNIENIRNYNCKYKFIGDSCQEYWGKESDNSYKIHATTAGKTIDFSEEIHQKIYHGHCGRGTVTFSCLQLAVYMGFTEIYLLGVDCNYMMGSKNNYFIREDVEDNKNHREDLMIQSYSFAKKYADDHGISIYNATRGGKLEVFERIDFDCLFERKVGNELKVNRQVGN